MKPALYFINILDVTGSMGSLISLTKTQLLRLMENFNKEVKQYLTPKYSLIVFRDHPPQDNTFVYKVLVNCESLTKLKKVLRSRTSDLVAMGGGDTPEAGLDAIKAIEELSLGKSGLKLAFLWGDAPFHGTPPVSNQCKCGLNHKDIQVFKEKEGVLLTSFALTQPAYASFKSFSDNTVTINSIHQVANSFNMLLKDFLSNIKVALEVVYPEIEDNPFISVKELQERTNLEKKKIYWSFNLLNKLNYVPENRIEIIC